MSGKMLVSALAIVISSVFVYWYVREILTIIIGVIGSFATILSTMYYCYPGKFGWLLSKSVDLLTLILPKYMIEAICTLFRIELHLKGLLEATVDSVDLCISVSNIIDRLTQSNNPVIMEMVVNPDTKLPSKLLEKVTDLLRSHSTRNMPSSQQSTLVIQAAMLVYRMVAWRASQAKVLQPLMVNLLLVIPDDVKVIFAALKATALLPTAVEASLLAKLAPWIKKVKDDNANHEEFHHIDPDLLAAIQLIDLARMTEKKMLEALEWAAFSEKQQLQKMKTELKKLTGELREEVQTLRITIIEMRVEEESTRTTSLNELRREVETLKTTIHELRNEVDSLRIAKGLQESQTAAFRFDSLSAPNLTTVTTGAAASVTVGNSGPDGSPNYAISGIQLDPSRPSQWQVEIVNPGGFMVLGVIGKLQPAVSLTCYNDSCFGWSSDKYVYVGGSDQNDGGSWEGWKMGDKGIFTYSPLKDTLSLRLLRGRSVQEFRIDNCILPNGAFIHFYFCFKGSTVKFSLTA